MAYFVPNSYGDENVSEKQWDFITSDWCAGACHPFLHGRTYQHIATYRVDSDYSGIHWLYCDKQADAIRQIINFEEQNTISHHHT